jgi:hypothetical protein
MRKINGRLEANKLYNKVRESINKYITDYKVESSEIREYVINNMDRFINKYGLSGIEGVKQIIIDVVDHKNNMTMDKTKKKKLISEIMNNQVIKFSKFKKVNESFIEVNKSSIEHEKALADYFNTSLGHIEEVDTENHIYSVKDFGKTQMVVIFSKDELKKIKEKVISDLVLEISDKNLIVEDVSGLRFDSEFAIQIGTVVEKSKLENLCERQIDERKVISLVSSHLSEELVFMYNFKQVEYLNSVNKYHIWKFS